MHVMKAAFLPAPGCRALRPRAGYVSAFVSGLVCYVARTLTHSLRSIVNRRPVHNRHSTITMTDNPVRPTAPMLRADILRAVKLLCGDTE